MQKGGQKGNTNALKHGFYSRQFGEQEQADLESLVEGGLADLASEIGMLRVAIRRTFVQANEAEKKGKAVDWAAQLAGLGTAATRVATMLRTQKILEGERGDEVNETIWRAITDAAKEMKLSV